MQFDLDDPASCEALIVGLAWRDLRRARWLGAFGSLVLDGDSSLEASEVDALDQIVWTESGRMHEIAELADDCTVFRNGKKIDTFTAGSKSDDEIIEMMIGREYHHVFPPKPEPKQESGVPVLEVRNLSWSPRLNGVSLTARAGEVVGLGGLDGQGQRGGLDRTFHRRV